ncbi:PREDICTED: uncharacterized protein LOC106807494 isoform X2 [Priapulus caudatus]|uniref:Uncharacterized protein LOC106807494 isoform X2 n=1 Tax=Priapulus caudatus TaxID=37621 RepID=A0ABM1DZE4_PRICU|nr:PREDICTED: uncharacterized protein LOC106807494 isoform X2 [Priapulus caudatus]
MSATSEFTGAVVGANQGSNCPASVHCIKNAMDNNPMTKWIANSNTNEEITFDFVPPISATGICIKYEMGSVNTIQMKASNAPAGPWINLGGPILVSNSTDSTLTHYFGFFSLPMEFRYYNILVIDTLASDPIAISDIYFQVTGECTDMCNLNAYCDTEGATPTCVCRDGWLGDGMYCYHTNTICDLDFGRGIVCGGDAIHGSCYANEKGIELYHHCICFPGWLQTSTPRCSEMDPSVDQHHNRPTTTTRD